MKKSDKEEIDFTQSLQGYVKKAMDETDLSEEHRKRLLGAVIHARTSMTRSEAKQYNLSHHWS